MVVAPPFFDSVNIFRPFCAAKVCVGLDLANINDLFPQTGAMPQVQKLPETGGGGLRSKGPREALLESRKDPLAVASVGNPFCVVGSTAEGGIFRRKGVLGEPPRNAPKDAPQQMTSVIYLDGSEARPGKGRDTVITPPSTESLVVVVTALDGWGSELKVRPTRTSPWAGEAASLRKLWFHGTTVTRLPVRAQQLRSVVVVEACLATFEVLFLLRPLLCTNRRSSAVERLTTALEQTLELMGAGYLFAPMQSGCCECVHVSGGEKSNFTAGGAT